MSVTANMERPSAPDGHSWRWFLALGIVFLIGGALAIAMPLASSLAVGILIAAVLAVAGVVQIFNAFRVQSWAGFALQLVIGIIALAGGLAVYFQPVVGTIALTLVVAAVFVAKGVAQIFLSMRIRPHASWGWILTAGIVALLVGLMIFFQWPFSGLFALGILAGFSLIFTGWSYVMMALMTRRAVA